MTISAVGPCIILEVPTAYCLLPTTVSSLLATAFSFIHSFIHSFIQLFFLHLFLRLSLFGAPSLCILRFVEGFLGGAAGDIDDVPRTFRGGVFRLIAASLRMPCRSRLLLLPCSMLCSSSFVPILTLFTVVKPCTESNPFGLVCTCFMCSCMAPSKLGPHRKFFAQ